jgi:hypothetical protein
MISRLCCILMVGLAVGSQLMLVAEANEPMPDRQLSLILRDVHDRGAALHNNGDSAGCYRMYQGALLVARQMLGHRPEVQKSITAGMQLAERETQIANRAIKLHELIEAVRTELAKPLPGGPEQITIPPRVVPAAPKPKASITEVPEGVVGRVLWQGMPLSGVQVSFVQFAGYWPMLFSSISGAEGVYAVANLPKGTYRVLLTPTPACKLKELPIRFSSISTTPLTLEMKGNGEKFDLLLQ